MPLFYAEVLRGVSWHDNNFKGLANNTPGAVSWTNFGGGAAPQSDGDFLSYTRTGAESITSPNISTLGYNITTTDHPYVAIRVRSSTPFTDQLALVYNDATSETFNIPFTTSWNTITVKPTLSGKRYALFEFNALGSGGTAYVDHVYPSVLPALQLSQLDLISGTAVPGSSSGPGYATLRLNNRRGKFVAGPNSINFGDHLHIYLGQGPTLFHAYGGECEYEEPVQPNDEMILQSRGFGIALQETIIGNQPTAAPIYTAASPQTIFNDFIDNHVNNGNKNGLGIASNYQITRSYVQNLGNTIGLYISLFKSAWDSMKEIADISVSQGFPGVFFVDSAENLHFVPLGAQGAANWGTDPFPATYGGNLTLGTNIVTHRSRRDVQSLRNRIHYFAVSQNPGKYGAWTEATASNWGSERLIAPTTATFSDDTTIIATGTSSVKCILANPNSAHYGGAMIYPATKNLGLNITSLGSVYAPPLFDFHFRVTQGANCKTTALGSPPTIFFATDATNRFEYNFVSDGNTAALQSILGVQGINNVTDNYWYHVLLPIGPNGGVLFNSTPVANTVAPTIYTGASQFQRTNIGAPSWSNINYVGVYWEDSGGCGNPSGSAPFWHNGWRIIGGRYLLAYDNRASPPRYKNMREIHFFDPISKDDAAIQNYAIAECKRLRNPIARVNVTAPLLADVHPEQQIPLTIPSANYSSTNLRINTVTHRFSPQGVLTEFQLSDDFVNAQIIEGWKLSNVLAQMGENAILSREVYDLKTAILDPSFKPQLIAVN